MSTTHDHFKSRMKVITKRLRDAEGEARALRAENKLLRDQLDTIGGNLTQSGEKPSETVKN